MPGRCYYCSKCAEGLEVEHFLASEEPGPQLCNRCRFWQDRDNIEFVPEKWVLANGNVITHHAAVNRRTGERL